MILHLLKLIWNQRKQNFWIIFELFVVFILLWIITDYLVTLGINASIPSGYDIRNTYKISLMTIPSESPDYQVSETERAYDNFNSILNRIKDHPDISEVCFSRMAMPYTPNMSDIAIKDKDNEPLPLFAQRLYVTPPYFSIFGISSLYGESPEYLNELLTENSFIITEPLARKLFPGENPVGKEIYQIIDDQDYAVRIADVTPPRKRHDYHKPNLSFYQLLSPVMVSKMSEVGLAELEITARIKPGVQKKDFPYTFQQEMNSKLAVGNFLLAGVTSFEDIKKSTHQIYGITDEINYRTAIIIFLLISIFLGVTGTFWFRNEYRRHELGLRMALGASQKSILYMTFMEGWICLNIITIPALLVCLNITLTDLLPTDIVEISYSRIISGFIITYILIAFIIFLGVFYPAWISSKLAPAETLRDE